MIQAWGEHPLPRPHMLFIKIFWDYFLPLLYLMDWSMLKTLGSVGTNFFMIIALELLLRTCNLGKGYSPPALVSLGFSEREQGSSAFVFLRGRRSQHCCLHLTSHRIDCTAPSMRVLYALHIVYFLLVKKKTDNKKGKPGWLVGTTVAAHARPWSISMVCGESSQLNLLIFQLQQMLTLNLIPGQV